MSRPGRTDRLTRHRRHAVPPSRPGPRPAVLSPASAGSGTRRRLVPEPADGPLAGYRASHGRGVRRYAEPWEEPLRDLEETRGGTP